MKLAICIVHNRDKGKVTDKLLAADFKFTIIGSTGGFLREGNSTFLIGFALDEETRLKEVVAANCCAREQLVNVAPLDAGAGLFPAPMKVPVGGAVMFILPVDQFIRF